MKRGWVCPQPVEWGSSYGQNTYNWFRSLYLRKCIRMKGRQWVRVLEYVSRLTNQELLLQVATYGKEFSVVRGETIDFVVDSDGDYESDYFQWPPVITVGA